MVRAATTVSVTDERAKSILEDIEKNYPRGTASKIFSEALLEFGGASDDPEKLEERLNELKDQEQTIRRAKENIRNKLTKIKENEEQKSMEEKIRREREEEKRKSQIDNINSFFKEELEREISQEEFEEYINGEFTTIMGYINYLKEKKPLLLAKGEAK